jgi:V8-like Glu-specific endopeptidase
MADPYTTYPYDTIVYVQTTIGGAGFQGSGVLIAPDEVLTASHVVYDSQYGAATSVEVTPAYDAQGDAPFGSEAAAYIHYNTVQDANDTISLYWSQFDYAVIHLAAPFTGLGTMGLDANFPGGSVNVSGYPASAYGAQVTDPEYVTPYPGYTLYQGTALGDGSSGGPVWIDGSQGPEVVGLVSSASGSTGYFTQLTTDAFNTIEGWVAQDNAPCFAVGTRLATIRGEVAIEDVRVGDVLSVHGGRTAPVIWTGHRRVCCARHPRPEDVWPVRVRPHAFAQEKPRRDLRLSPDHAVFARGALIPVRYLVNGATIVHEPVAEVTYWHVELPRHDIIFAEGLATESYLDTGNRAAFTGGRAVHLHPDFARRVWQSEGCATLLTEGPSVIALRRRLLARARRLGHRLTNDPALIVCDESGRRLSAWRDGRRWRVALPRGARAIRLRSRSFVPAEVRPDASDARRLGIALSRLWLDGRAADPASPALTRGWHAAEPGWRWTDGDAEIPLSGLHELAFEVALFGEYWLPPADVAGATTIAVA